jgi:hypothetical protein
MARSIKSLYGTALSARDGEIGVIRDCYFDDQEWAVRYLVIDTGSWLSDRKVLIPPHAIAGSSIDERRLRVDLTIAQIEGSPSIDAHKPVSRQYEEDYYRYYGWPYYWQGNGLWGRDGIPAGGRRADDDEGVDGEVRRLDDKHLRSTQAVDGYQAMAIDGSAGFVEDFFMDSRTWSLLSISLKTGGWFNRTIIPLATRHISSIDYEGSTVTVDLTLDQIRSGSDAVDPALRTEAPGPGASAPQPLPEDGPRQADIAALAYSNYVHGGSQPGHDVRHWLAAEDQLRATPATTSPAPSGQALAAALIL